MEIKAPSRSDWQIFYALAEQEGWRIPEVEKGLLQSLRADSAKVLIASGRFCGLVTAVAHARSGWIGNLIVPRQLRERGYGTHLFGAALSSLLGLGVSSVWLTASGQGKPLYVKNGFVEVGQIERWRLLPGLLPATGGGFDGQNGSKLSDLDRTAWGECRQPFLNHLREGNPVVACNESAALLQQEEALQIIGPWYSKDLCLGSNRMILQQLLISADPAVEIVADVLAASPVRSLLAAAMFEQVGQTSLMVYGDASGVDLTTMVSFASLGSIG